MLCMDILGGVEIYISVSTLTWNINKRVKMHITNTIYPEVCLRYLNYAQLPILNHQRPPLWHGEQNNIS